MYFSGNDDNLVAFKTEDEALIFTCSLKPGVMSFYHGVSDEEAQRDYPQYRKVINEYPPRTIVNRAGVVVGRA